LSAESYHDTIVTTKTEFEQVFSRDIIKAVLHDYHNDKKILNMEKVNQICKDYNITYSRYQQMESLYLRKLQYANV
jgi:hypothetical protein